MKILRFLMMFLCAGALISSAEFVRLGGWYWILALWQFLITGALVEIIHSMCQKPKMAHPTSLAFQKEMDVLNRYKL